MINLMQQLQAWADEGRYDFEGRRFRTLLAWVDIENPNPKQLKILREHYGYYEITDYILDKIKGVLDGTIQVWRPVEHYPLKEGDTVLVRINPELKDGNASGYAVCRYETEYPLSGGEYHDLLIERPLIGDDMFDVLCDAKNYEGEEIDPCKFKLELSDITHWMPLYRLAQPPQEVK
jgi:hypothetical protein